MTDVASLGLEVKSNQVLKGAAALDELDESSKKAAAGADRLRDAASRANYTMGGFGRQANASSRALGGMTSPLRNVGFQLNQVAQQGAITGDFFSAFAFQLPDLLIGFGTLGIFAGVLAGALVPLGQSIRDAYFSAEDFEESLKDLETAAASVRFPLDLLTSSIGELREEFGDSAESVREYAVELANLEVAKAERELLDLVDTLSDLAGEYTEVNRVLDEFGESIDRSEAIRNIADDFGVSREEAVRLQAAFERLGEAETLGETQAALLEIRDLMRDAEVNVRQLPGAFQDAFAELLVLNIEAERLKELMEAAAYASSRIGGDGDRDAGRESALFGTGVRPRPRPIDWPPTVGGRGGGRGGRRISEAEREHLRNLREGERLYRQVRTALEEYNEESVRYGELLEGNYISQETFNRLMRELDEELLLSYQNVSRLDDMFAQLFGTIVSGSESATDALSSVLRQLSAMAGAAAFRGLFGNAFGALGPIFGVGSNAAGTDYWRGGWTMVGEEGPELVNLPRGSQVLSTERTAGALSGTGNFTFAPNITIGDASSDALRRVEEMVQRLNSDFEGRVLMALREGANLSYIQRVQR